VRWSAIGPALALGLAFGALGSPTPAAATTVELELGSSYWLVHEGAFDVDLAILAPLASSFSVGGRFGAVLVTGDPLRVGIPLDLVLHVAIPGSRLYLEGLAGPWIFFQQSGIVRAHVAFGFGVVVGSIAVGAELGYLDPEALLGVKVGFRF
jgi:hypothetical protein